MNRYLKRGNLLWESHRMFLPEHKQALLQRKQQLREVAKPLLDDQELESIGIVAADSLNYEIEIVLEYWKDGFLYSIIGVVDRIDLNKKQIKVLHQNEDIFIPIDCLKRADRIP